MDLEHYGKPREREFTNLAIPAHLAKEQPEVTDTGAKIDSTLNFLEEKKEDLKVLEANRRASAVNVTGELHELSKGFCAVLAGRVYLFRKLLGFF